MAPRTQRGWIASLLPKTKRGRMASGILALAVIVGASYYAGASTYRMETAAKRFVDRYQHIDQRQYRAAL